MTNKVNILIISPQQLFRRGVEIMLSAAEEVKIIGSIDFSNGVQLSLDELPPDIALVDIDSSIDTSIEIAQRVKQRLPSVGVIMFTSNPNDDELFQALKAQAVAYLSKEVTADEMINIIRRVARGDYPINDNMQTNPKVAEHVLQQFQKFSLQEETGTLISPLTRRETEIVGYIAQGYLNKQIAAELEISEQTIKNHVTSVLRKLNANARTEAVVIALKQGIISLD